MSKVETLSEEIINEIGTQTLARLGLNIFSLNTYSAYDASVKATNIVSDTYNRKKNSSGYFGDTFEDLDVGQSNITSQLFNKGETGYTTDEVADIRSVHNILNSNKKYENLSSKDKAKVDRVKANYSDKEISDIVNNKNLDIFTKHDTNTDVVTLNGKGEIVKKEQHKVRKDTEGFFEKEKVYDSTGKVLKDENGKPIYKKDKNGNPVYKYIENNDALKVPFDDYKRHKEELEKIIDDPKTDSHKKEQAQKALGMLNKNNVTNRLMCENPRTTAVITQSLVSSGHVVQAGLSDAIIVALSTLANGAIWEIKDALNDNGSDASITERIKRLLKKVIKEFNKTFKRGASFGVLDVGVGILSQIFKSISSKLRFIWKNIRNSFKSIYNAIYSYMTGEIKTYKELISTIIKGFFSAIMVVSTVALETQLETFLAPIVTPIVASFLAPALSIVIGSIAVVLMSNTVDITLNTLFGVFAQRDISKMKAEKIRELYDELLPSLVEEREELKTLIEKTYKDRKLSFEKSFIEFKKGLSVSDTNQIICGLIGINELYGKKLQFQTQKEFDEFMLNECSLKL